MEVKRGKIQLFLNVINVDMYIQTQALIPNFVQNAAMLLTKTISKINYFLKSLFFSYKFQSLVVLGIYQKIVVKSIYTIQDVVKISVFYYRNTYFVGLKGKITKSIEISMVLSYNKTINREF